MSEGFRGVRQVLPRDAGAGEPQPHADESKLKSGPRETAILPECPTSCNLDRPHFATNGVPPLAQYTHFQFQPVDTFILEK